MRGDVRRAAHRRNRYFRFSPHEKKRYVVLVHVVNQIAFRRVPPPCAVGKNTTMFQSRANQDMSCCEHGSLMWLNRRTGVGRHTSVIPEAPVLETWGVVTRLTDPGSHISRRNHQQPAT